MRLYYFPFEKAETLPIPFDIEVGAEEEVPIQMRKPGVDVYWNERLIKDAHIPLITGFGFTRPGIIEKVKLEERWFNRVKGMLFINSDFPVTHNSKKKNC